MELLEVGVVMREAVYKVPNGKMLRVRLESSGDTIDYVVIMGDFFLHPEELLSVIEGELSGQKIDSEELTARIARIIRDNNAVLLGASPADIVHAIILAHQSRPT